MITFAIHFEDDPAAAALREEHAGAHRRYLDGLGERLVLAGRLDREAEAVGGLWLLRAASELEAREVIEGDPYFEHGLRRAVRIWRFSASR